MSVNNNDIKQAFMPKIDYAMEKLNNCFVDGNEQLEKAEKYLNLVHELYAQMITAFKNKNT